MSHPKIDLMRRSVAPTGFGRQQLLREEVQVVSTSHIIIPVGFGGDRLTVRRTDEWTLMFCLTENTMRRGHRAN